VTLVAGAVTVVVGALLAPEWMRQIRVMRCFARAGVTAQRPDVTPQRIMTPPALRNLG
jgi:hypothetical protein